jgi:hypothetical protein
MNHGPGMRNHHAAVRRRLSDPDFQGSLVTKCLAVTLGMGALLAVSLIHDAYVWMNPIEPRYQAQDVASLWDVHVDDLIPSRNFRRVHYGEA